MFLQIKYRLDQLILLSPELLQHVFNTPLQVLIACDRGDFPSWHAVSGTFWAQAISFFKCWDSSITTFADLQEYFLMVFS